MDTFGRYSCQMALPGFGPAAQRKLQAARVLIVGAGGLGCPAGQYLAAAGLGEIGIADDDLVSESNLHRQILFTPQDIGKYKAEVAARKLQAQNPSVKITAYPVRVCSQNVMELIAGFDLVVDASDNFETKYLLNDGCVLSHKPLVYGAIYRYEGQLAVLNVPQKDGSYSPNYRDIFPHVDSHLIPDCSEGGVLPPLAGMVGCMQASEVIKYFTDKEALLTGRLCMINMKEGSIYQIGLRKLPDIIIDHLPETVKLIDVDVLKETDFQLIDVRSAAEHAAFNIGGELVPLEVLKDRLDGFKINVPIVFYCTSGKRSLAAAHLAQQYFPALSVYSLRDGIEHLRKAEC